MISENKSKRIDISLPIRTIELVDHIWPKKGFKSRSSFFDEAATRYAIRLQKANLKRKLKEGYIARAERDLNGINDWEAASSELISESNQ